MRSMSIEFDARAQTAGSDWFPWRPAVAHTVVIRGMDEKRYVTEDNWEGVKDFVQAQRNPPLTWSLISGAEKLAANGHTRSALTEAVTALEVALFTFAGNVNAEKAFGPVLSERMGLESLKRQFEKGGLSGTVRYLLPILLTEEQLPDDTLKGCQRAIEERQNVVHNGQRAVEELRLRQHLRSIRRLCGILDDLQNG